LCYFLLGWFSKTLDKLKIGSDQWQELYIHVTALLAGMDLDLGLDNDLTKVDVKLCGKYELCTHNSNLFILEVVILRLAPLLL